MKEFDKNPANYVPLTPLSFLARAAAVHPNRLAVVHGAHRATWRETEARCRRFAAALAAHGVGRGDVVAVMTPNTPPLFEAHFAVPMLGAVLNAMNTRLDAETIAYILEHGEARVLIADREFSATVAAALALLPEAARPLVIDVDDPLAAAGAPVGAMEYEAFLQSGDPAFAFSLPPDEWGRHRAELHFRHDGQAEGRGLPPSRRVSERARQHRHLEHAAAPGYLWTLPMFHCNGWCFPWTVTALAGTHVCLRRVEAGAILAAMDAEGVTHLCGAPIVMGMILNAPGVQPRPAPVFMMTAGAAPACRRHRRDGAAGLRRHACLRADRVLRPRHRLRVGRRLGCAAAG